jgi:hypothetical protein
MGQKKVNPNGKVDKEKNEKVTDFIRKMIEKFTGYVRLSSVTLLSILFTQC